MQIKLHVLILNVTFVPIEKNNIVYKLINSGNRSDRQRFFTLFLMGLSVMFFFSGRLNAQMRIDIGPLGGAAYYMGDLNPGVPFSQVREAFGGLARYVVNDRIAVKGAMTFATLKGVYDPDKVGKLPNLKGEMFMRSIFSVDVTGEINLFSYDHQFISSTVFSPYLAIGVGTMGYKKTMQADTTLNFTFSLPMGVGVKYKINKRLKIGAEWTFYKLFVDDIDNYVSAGDALTHNNDWFSVFKIYITFGFLRRKSECFGMCTRTVEDRRKR